jgi:HSP20 family protein
LIVAEEKKNGAVAVQERRPAGLFAQIEQEFEDARRRMMDLFRRPATVSYGQPLLADTAWAPTADMYEADGTLVIKAELPGVKREDITVGVDGGMLTLTGQRKEEREIKEARYYAAERFAGSFTRSFALPDGVDAKDITAEYKDGVLEIRVPMPAMAKADPVKIAVKG